jgi:hypothetical protein
LTGQSNVHRQHTLLRNTKRILSRELIISKRGNYRLDMEWKLKKCYLWLQKEMLKVSNEGENITFIKASKIIYL